MGNRSSKSADGVPQPMMEQTLGYLAAFQERSHPQERFSETEIEQVSFYGKLRSLYASKVLKTQLDQLRKQGSYDAFKLGWHPKYDIGRLHGGKSTLTGSPPSLFWDSDVAKWIEAACYFLISPAGETSSHAQEFNSAISELVDMIVKAQQPDGYIGTYFTVVDRPGRLQNLRDMHEMYCCGHLLEAALAHHKYSGETKFLNAMIKYVELLMSLFGSGNNQKHGYPGHPELELAVLRLFSRTKDPRHYAFGKYLVETRGRREPDYDEKRFFVWEAEQRKDFIFHAGAMDSIDDGRYSLWHAELAEQDTILGHSVRALYLLTAAADLQGKELDAAKWLWNDCVDDKMYPTGGIGSIPSIEGFSEIAHYLPNAHDEGGCYAETCASIACMMVSERLLSHEYDTKARDVLERCLLNNVLGGASLNGKQFYYANRLATCNAETSDRSDWFDVCCCPPNLTRTMGMLGGYIWTSRIRGKVIELDVYMMATATLKKRLPDGSTARAVMSSEMPWKGTTSISLSAPEGWSWLIRLPKPEYGDNLKVESSQSDLKIMEDQGLHPRPYVEVNSPSSGKLNISFDMPVRLLSPHPATHQDTLAVSRGPIIYTVESYDNEDLESSYPHFANVGILESTTFEEESIEIEGIPMISLVSREPAYGLVEEGKGMVGSLTIAGSPARSWWKLDQKIRFVPFFARANRRKGQRMRTMLSRVATSDIQSPRGLTADDRFKRIYEEVWAWRLHQHLETEEDDDGRGIMDYLPSVSADVQAERQAYWKDIYARLKKINVDDLSPAESVNYGVYKAQIEVFLNQQHFRDFEKPLNADSAFWSDLSMAPNRSFKKKQDYENYLSQLKEVTRYFDEQTANMREGVRRGFTPPKVTLEGRDQSIASIAEARSATDTAFYKPFVTMPETISTEVQRSLRQRATELIDGSVIPAYAKLLRFYREDYYPNARTSLAAKDLPDGKGYYAATIKEFTTLDYSPERIHTIGLEEIRKLDDLMSETMKQSGYKGQFKDFLHFLRTDLQFYAKTPDQLLKEAAWICKEFDGVASKYFGRLPRQRFAIKPVPDDIAPYWTSGRGGPGVYYVNTYDLPSRALYSLPALTLHESAPGHAFQMPLALEHDNLPHFRREYISAYGEGWALYCEWLGTEMGMYKSPYDRFGMLSYQAWRAARLVVDTGIHAKGWTRKQAQDYLADHTALSTHEIETEVDRYIAWPGQALSYYLGELAILAGRKKAEEELGDRFNLAAFHDMVLSTGCIPLPLLERQIDLFIFNGGVGPYRAEEV